MTKGIAFDFSNVRLGNGVRDLPFHTWLVAKITNVSYVPVGDEVRLELGLKIEHNGQTIETNQRISPRQGWLMAQFLHAVGVDPTKITVAVTEKFAKEKLQGKYVEIKYKENPGEDRQGNPVVYHQLNAVQAPTLAQKASKVDLGGTEDAPWEGDSDSDLSSLED